MRKQRVLFICVHNSARSQMAAALLNETCGEFFEGESAGLEPGTINPLAVDDKGRLLVLDAKVGFDGL